MKIDYVTARQILDSRGTPTVEADVHLEGGVIGRAAVPSGASTGSHEAVEIRDGGDEYGGKAVQKAVHNVLEEISPKLKGVMADDQFKVDQIMIDLDCTEQKSRLGANAMLAVSLAVAHAAAQQRGLPLYQHINDVAQNPKMSLPMPMMNVLNGGKHANNSSDFQEFMIVPVGADSYAQAVQIGAEVFMELKKMIASFGFATSVGDEGGFTVPVRENAEMLELLVGAIERTKYKAGKDVVIALDVAANEFFDGSFYFLECENRQLSSDEMIDNLCLLTSHYPIVSIEDGLAEDDWSAWQQIVQKLPHTQIVGDDLLVTNVKRLQQAIEMSSANAILIKPNQIGTLTETLSTIKLAQDNGFSTIVSHRSGETEDTTIAHLAVGSGAGQIKTGSLSRSDRNAKHNELIRIEEDAKLKLENPFVS